MQIVRDIVKKNRIPIMKYEQTIIVSLRLFLENSPRVLAQYRVQSKLNTVRMKTLESVAIFTDDNYETRLGGLE